MADVDLAIAGRSYRVACADGQEANLAEAGAMIASEAEALREEFGGRFATLSEARVILMSSLMLADRLRGKPVAMAQPPAEAAEGPEQQGLFEDPVQTARIRELELALAQAQAGEAAAVAALEEAARQVRALTADLAEETAA
ncbi:MAG: cell division protein ZapA [Pseudomonadota bacterium]